MKSRLSRNHLIAILGALSIVIGACTKTVPEVNPELLGKITFDTSSTTLPSLSVNDASGFCPAGVTRIQIRLDGGAWLDLLSIDPSAQITCSTDGKFTFDLDLNASWASAAKTKLQAGQSVNFQAQGFSDMQMTSIGSIMVSLGGSQGAPSKILAGVHRSTCQSNCSTGRTLSGQINFQAPTTGVVLQNPGATRQLIGIIRTANQ